MRQSWLVIALLAAAPLQAQETDKRKEELEKLKAEAAAKADRIVELQRQLDREKTDQAAFVEQLKVQLARIKELNEQVEELRQKVAPPLKAPVVPAIPPVPPAAPVPVSPPLQPATPYLTLKSESHRKVARLLSDALAAFTAQEMNRCVQLCDEILLIDPQYSVAKELKEDTKRVAANPAYYELLARKVVEWKKLTNAEQGLIPWPSTLRASEPVVKVTAVANEINLVVLSAGKDDGVAEGDEFTLTRAGDFVANVKIDRADRKWSAGKVLIKKMEPRVADDAVKESVNRPVEKAAAQALAKVAPAPSVPADELRRLRKELDEVRSLVRQLSDRLIPAWQDSGVSVDEASDELRTHLGILRGLLVRRVREGSPAEKAGLAANDVVPDLLEPQLIEAIRTGAPLNILRRGQPLRLAGVRGR